MKYFMRFNFDMKQVSRYCKCLFLVLSFVVILSQILLCNNDFRKYLTSIDMLEGTIPVNADILPKKGFVKLKLLSGNPSENIKILVNGEEYCSFENTDVEVEISYQSVIEVVNCTNKKISVAIAELSDNVTSVFDNGTVDIENIGVVARVVLE